MQIIIVIILNLVINWFTPVIMLLPNGDAFTLVSIVLILYALNVLMGTHSNLENVYQISHVCKVALNAN